MARSRRIHDSPSGIEVQCAEAIAFLRMVQPGPGLVRELWVCNHYGTLRFFRVESSYLIEIGRDGRVLMGIGGPDKKGKLENGEKPLRARVPSADVAAGVSDEMLKTWMAEAATYVGEDDDIDESGGGGPGPDVTGGAAEGSGIHKVPSHSEKSSSS
jgi:hypothetical protein